MIAEGIESELISFHQEDAPDSADPATMEATEGEALGSKDIDLLADPACWHPFPSSCQIFRKEGRTIGFRTRSDVMFGPNKIEIRPDASGQQWVFRFITHDYSVPVETSVLVGPDPYVIAMT